MGKERTRERGRSDRIRQEKKVTVKNERGEGEKRDEREKDGERRLEQKE